ncbi:hypothetical protein B0H13DRAFT_2467405 [Mycena leptocephala]|nr:hypothetical protein B0H13DRAFT_2467405 [Mycena leptocephala]
MMTYIPLAVVATLPLLRSVVASPILMGGGIGAGATVTVTITPPSIASPSTGGIGISSVLSSAAAVVSAPANSAVNIVPASSVAPVVSSVIAAIPIIVSGAASAASAASAAFSGAPAAPSSSMNPPVAFVSGAVSSLAPVPSAVIGSVVAGVSASVISPAASFVGAVASSVTPIPSVVVGGAAAMANGVEASASVFLSSVAAAASAPANSRSILSRSRLFRRACRLFCCCRHPHCRLRRCICCLSRVLRRTRCTILVVNPPVAFVSGAVSSLAPVPSAAIGSVVAGVSASVISPAASFVGAVASSVTPIPSVVVGGAAAMANGVAASASAFANSALISAAAAPSAINSAAVATVSSSAISTAATVSDVKQSLDRLNVVLSAINPGPGIKNTADQLGPLVSATVTALNSLTESNIIAPLTPAQLDTFNTSISAFQNALNLLNSKGFPADIAATLKPLIGALLLINITSATQVAVKIAIL